MTAFWPRVRVRACAVRRAVSPVASRAAEVAGVVTPLGVLLALVPLVAVLATNGRLVLHQCVSGDGLLGSFGMRFALLGGSVDCPAGAVGLTPFARTGVVLVLSLALPVLATYLVLAVGGIGLTAVLARVAASVVALLGAVLASVLRVCEIVVGPARVVGGRDQPTRLFTGLPTAHRRRGPPVVLA